MNINLGVAVVGEFIYTIRHYTMDYMVDLMLTQQDVSPSWPEDDANYALDLVLET
jgi:hypothetical protein